MADYYEPTFTITYGGEDRWLLDLALRTLMEDLWLIEVTTVAGEKIEGELVAYADETATIQPMTALFEKDGEPITVNIHGIDTLHIP